MVSKPSYGSSQQSSSSSPVVLGQHPPLHDDSQRSQTSPQEQESTPLLNTGQKHPPQQQNIHPTHHDPPRNHPPSVTTFHKVLHSTKTHLWNPLTFQWLTPLLHRGNEQNQLHPDDLRLVPLMESCHSRTIQEQFDQCWKEELQRHPQNPSLTRALLYAFGYDFAKGAVLKAIHDVCLFVGPQVLRGMIAFLRTRDAPLSQGLWLTLAVTLSQCTMSLCVRHYFFHCYTTGLRARTAMVVAVYRKVLVLAVSERQGKGVGEITNLMSIDAQRLQDLTTYLNAIWSSPLQITLALYFLFQELGASSLGGVAVILCMIPLSKWVAAWMGNMQQRLMKARDVRTELNAEVVAQMKVVKFQAWEEAFAERILGLRAVELKQLLHYYIGNACSKLLWTFTPLLVALVTFAVYVLVFHQELDVASALTALALFDLLRFPLNMLPQTINSLVEAFVTLRRLQSFLLCDEYVSIDSLENNNIDDDMMMRGEPQEDGGFCLEKLSATYDAKTDAKIPANVKDHWEVNLMKAQLEDAERRIQELTKKKEQEKSDRRMSNEDSLGLHMDDETASLTTAPNHPLSSILCLRRIDLTCQPGELIAVVGAVGSGKTSLLNSVLGEVRQLSGTASLQGKLAYFSQTPFVMNASIRDNILFGHNNSQETIDEARYETALDCCALTHDLQLLPDGDETEVGERGITLSGGQKARVALARAVYHGADITLIDDALAAVDAHVAKHLFEQAIVGELCRSTNPHRSVILATNALQYLNHPRVTKIVVMQEGRIIEEGSYQELLDNADSVFSRFLLAIKDTDVGDELDSDEKHTSESNKKKVSPLIQKTVKVLSPAKVKIKPNKPTKLISEEKRQTGHVGVDVYLEYVQAAGGYWVPIVIVVMFALVESINVLSNYWLTVWSANATEDTQVYYLGTYAVINVSAAIAYFVRIAFVSLIGLKASRELFSRLLHTVLHASMSFFDTTPVGRLVNRFSKDIYCVDEELTLTLSMYLWTLSTVISTMAVIIGVTPVLVCLLLPMVAFYIKEQLFFTVTYRELKRLDSVARSPIYALLGESVDGVAVIRAFGAQSTMYEKLLQMLDLQQHAYFLTCTAQSWLALRLELIGTLIVTSAALIATLQHKSRGGDPAFAGCAGLAIKYALSVTQSLNWSVRMASDMEANMVAVERIREFCDLPTEGERDTPIDKDLPTSWPTEGAVTFENVKMQYRPGLPLVLKGLNLQIPAGAKVGIVGRTGAGKSTLMVALMRIVGLTEGRILIDNQDIRQLGLRKLRQNLAIISQDPVLFTGTVRTNLDPFEEYTEEQLYAALQSVGLYSDPTEMNEGEILDGNLGDSNHTIAGRPSRVESLEDPVTEGGTNFSVGQRQLVVIARALLHGSRILIMDEATASIDAELDATIQQVIRTEFASATCLTVAHRLNTIMDSDLILVMDDGKAAEFDSPSVLLQKPDGMFRELVRAAAHES